MADVSVLLKSCGLSRKASIRLLLESAEHSQMLQDKSAACEWIAEMNDMLGVRKDRWMGICLLASIVKQCQTDVFLENCLSWLKSLGQILQQEKENVDLCNYAAVVLEKIMAFSVQFSEISKETSLTFIPSFLNSAVGIRAMDPAVQLIVLKACVQFYPGASASFAKRVESLIFDIFDSGDWTLIQEACRCFAILPRCGVVQVSGGGDKQTLAWEMQWKKILRTLLDIIGELYSTYETGPLLKIDSDVLQLKKISLVEPQRTETCILRIQILLNCLDLMLRNSFCQAKSVNIPLDLTSKIIEKILAVNAKTVKNNMALESVLLKFYIAAIHESTVKFLSSLILCCGMNLLPYHQQIARILFSELSWTESEEKKYGSQQEYGKLRSVIYECLEYLVHVTSSVGENTGLVKKIISHVLADVKPVVNTTKLLAAPTSSKNSLHGKKAKRKRIQDDVTQLRQTEQKTNYHANEHICYFGLRALNTIILKGSLDIPVNIMKEIQIFVVGLLLECQQVSNSQSHYPVPYSSPECRKMLYSVLKSLLYHHDPRNPPPLQHAILIFSHGTQDEDIEVSRFCFEAQMFYQTLIHPRVPVLSRHFHNVDDQNTRAEAMADATVTAISRNGSVSEETSVIDQEKQTYFQANDSFNLAERSSTVSCNAASDSSQNNIGNNSTITGVTNEVIDDQATKIANDKIHDRGNRENFGRTDDVNFDVSTDHATEKDIHIVFNSNKDSSNECSVNVETASAEIASNVLDPPLKRRKTLNEANQGVKDVSRSYDAFVKSTKHNEEEMLKLTEDENMAAEMICSFIDSVPD